MDIESEGEVRIERVGEREREREMDIESEGEVRIERVREAQRKTDGLESRFEGISRSLSLSLHLLLSFSVSTSSALSLYLSFSLSPLSELSVALESGSLTSAA